MIREAKIFYPRVRRISIDVVDEMLTRISEVPHPYQSMNEMASFVEPDATIGVVRGDSHPLLSVFREVLTNDKSAILVVEVFANSFLRWKLCFRLHTRGTTSL
jgi:hypothetical protein